jgi:very-short-patch-repair endonuclease
VNNTTPVSIICPIHGEFLQKPCNHLNNCGCVYCNRNYLTKDDFIKRAKEVHGDKYDYSKVSEPIKTKQPVTIICPVHGEFQQTPVGHIIKRSGCSQCVVDSRRLSQDDFIKRVKEVHGDRYDYSLSVYESYHSNITIICPTHGKFQQAASIHISGAGCPKCNISSRLEERVQNFLITNNISFDIQVTWPWLQFSSKQYVDFYLPDYNIAIECQGKQHFEPVEFFGGEEGFKYCTERDKNKLKLCNEHGIKVVYFSNLSTSTKCYQYPYKVYEDISQLFKEELNIEIN